MVSGRPIGVSPADGAEHRGGSGVVPFSLKTGPQVLGAPKLLSVLSVFYIRNHTEECPDLLIHYQASTFLSSPKIFNLILLAFGNAASKAFRVIT